MEVYKNYFSSEELIKFAKQNNISEVYFDDLLAFVENDITEMISTNDHSDSEIKQSALDFALDYFTKFDQEIKKGHSQEWANALAKSIENPLNAFNEAYWFIRKSKSPFEARKELEVHCKSIQADEWYTKHFLYLFENGGGSDNPDKKASIYSKVFKKLMEVNKSAIYAHEYADSLAEGYAELYASVYAQYYEITHLEDRAVGYSLNFAEEIAKYVVNTFNPKHDYENDEGFKNKLKDLRNEYYKKIFKR